MNGWETPEQPPPEPEIPRVEKSPFWGYRDFLFFLAAALPAVIAASLIVKAVFVGFSLSETRRAPEVLAAQFLAYGLWFAALYAILRAKYGRPFWRSMGFVQPFDNFLRHLGSGLLVALAIAIGALLLRTPDLDMPIKQFLQDRTSILLIGLAAATIGPVCEELAFRGFIQPLLTRTMGAPIGILVTALPFALLHGPQYGWSWRHLLFIVIAGAAFGWKRYRTGSTAAAAIMHAAYNLTFFATFVLHGKDLPAKW